MPLTKAQKEANLRLFNKRRQKILKATDNGRCWWLYQQLTSVKPVSYTHLTLPPTPYV